MGDLARREMSDEIRDEKSARHAMKACSRGDWMERKKQGLRGGLHRITSNNESDGGQHITKAFTSTVERTFLSPIKLQLCIITWTSSPNIPPPRNSYIAPCSQPAAIFSFSIYVFVTFPPHCPVSDEIAACVTMREETMNPARDILTA